MSGGINVKIIWIFLLLSSSSSSNVAFFAGSIQAFLLSPTTGRLVLPTRSGCQPVNPMPSSGVRMDEVMFGRDLHLY